MNDRSQSPKDSRNVGYKKPPREGQFKKGQSGNRKGPPRRLKSVAQIFREVASEVVTIEGEGGSLTMTRWEAMVRQIHTMALNKDHGAARLVDRLRRHFPGRLPEGDPTIIVLSEDEMRI